MVVEGRDGCIDACMSIALECRAVRKRFSVGVAHCTVRAEVLRGVDFDVHEGEATAIVGPRGSGKSTLLLCAAGLLKPDSGEIRWFGRGSPSTASHVATYYWTTIELTRPSENSGPRVHLIDFAIANEQLSHVVDWFTARQLRGDAVLLATRDETLARALCSRVLFLEHGCLTSFSRATRVARVAEPSVRGASTAIEPHTQPR